MQEAMVTTIFGLVCAAVAVAVVHSYHQKRLLQMAEHDHADQRLKLHLEPVVVIPKWSVLLTVVA